MLARVSSTRSSRTASRRPAGAALTLLAMVMAITFAGCPCLKGATDASPGFRWWLFANFGASKICPEMLKRGVPLRLQDRAPAIGRFFPMQCSHQVDNARQTVTVHFAGTGYGYMLPAKRIGFTCTGSVEYRIDFQITDEGIYVWGKPSRVVQGPVFQLGYVENPIVDIATAVTPLGSVANFFGNQIVAGELTRGFTAVHDEDKGDDFSLGILYPPTRPHHPFDTTGSERYTFANETIEVQSQQRDYLGPFEVADGDQSLYLQLSVQGPAVDVMVVSKGTGDLWRDSYQKGQPLGQPPGPVVAGGPLNPGINENRKYKVPPGLYYVVIDNTSAAGNVGPAPPTLFNPLGSGAAARVNYVAQVGD